MILRFLILCLMLIVPNFAMAQDKSFALGDWTSLPILHEGRVKPIDSFARIHLKKFSNASRLNGISANQWLVQSLFEPDKAVSFPIFKIRNFQEYYIEEKPSKLYSYQDTLAILEPRQDAINALLKLPKQEWNSNQRQLIELYSNVQDYTQILRSMTAILPLQTDEGIKDYLSLPAHHPAKKIIEIGGTQNHYFKIFSIDGNNPNSDWLSLWQQIVQNENRVIPWQSLAQSYLTKDQTQWNKNIESLKTTNITPRLSAEVIYNQINFIFWAGVFYGLSLLIYIIVQLAKKHSLQKIASYSLSTAVLFNAIDIGLRVYILTRPPIGTLFESIIFVALICSIIFLFFELKKKDGFGLLLGSLSGLLLILTAKSFAGVDTMDTLVAVLNTNFWLLTHVICITIGYSTCLLTSFTAHYYLLAPKQMHHKNIMRYTHTFMIFALLFTTIGTILGGIWADQSWGRFWGWDPKENGALLIILWIVWLLHGRISQHVSQTGFMIGSALLSIVVVLAWFGVNLLSVGLHSYGFISGIAASIAGFCVIELILIFAGWFFLHYKKEQER